MRTIRNLIFVLIGWYVLIIISQKSVQDTKPRESVQDTSQTESVQDTSQVENNKQTGLFHINLRSKPKNRLSIKAAEEMLIRNKLFDKGKNRNCSGLPDNYELVADGKAVYDRSTGLMWQQSGSSKKIEYDHAKSYISQLNQKKFAGFADWRLPTLEEAMSLMKPVTMMSSDPKYSMIDLHISPFFSYKQYWIWTADRTGFGYEYSYPINEDGNVEIISTDGKVLILHPELTYFPGEEKRYVVATVFNWCAYYDIGTCFREGFGWEYFVRAVRSAHEP